LFNNEEFGRPRAIVLQLPSLNIAEEDDGRRAFGLPTAAAVVTRGLFFARKLLLSFSFSFCVPISITTQIMRSNENFEIIKLQGEIR